MEIILRPNYIAFRKRFSGTETEGDIMSKFNYIGFYYNINRIHDILNKNELSTKTAMATNKINMAKLHYFKLKERGIENIEDLRECLTTLEKELGMEVTE